MEFEGGREEYVMNGKARIVRATRQPCIICGATNGDCTGELAPPTRVIGPDIFPSLQHEETFVVSEDVYETLQISAMTTTTILVAAKGTAIPVSKAKELGLL